MASGFGRKFFACFVDKPQLPQAHKHTQNTHLKQTSHPQRLRVTQLLQLSKWTSNQKALCFMLPLWALAALTAGELSHFRLAWMAKTELTSDSAEGKNSVILACE